jgi:cleavage stimulation factor subunit 3
MRAKYTTDSLLFSRLRYVSACSAILCFASRSSLVQITNTKLQARVWLELAHWEQDNGENGRVEQLLGNSLNKVLDTKMWHFYLNFCRRRHPLINDHEGRNRTLLSQVFEVVLDKVGIDPDAGELWKEYIEFIKSGPGQVGQSGWQDMQKSDLLRKAYQRAVAVPHDDLIKLWKEYDTFETSQNRVAGRKNLNEQGASYMTAKSAKTQLDGRLAGLDRTSLPKLPPVYGCEGEDEFGFQVEKWQEWIRWEQADELVLKNEDDGAQYRKRVLFVLKQATMSLRFYPNIWYDAAVWCFEQGRDDMIEEGEKFLDEGIAANPESVLLALKKADRVEGALPAGSSDDIIIQNGTKLDAIYESSLAALYSLRDKYAEREKRVQAGVQEHFANMTPEEEQENQDDDNDDMDEDEKPKSRKDQLEEQLKNIKMSFDVHRDLLKRTISAVWSAKMRAFRRIQGQGAPKQPKKGFRGVFAEARPRGMLTSDVYVVSALLEHHCYRDPAATRIFERGLKLFPVDELFALEYIKHLVSINDLTNAKVVFETTLTKILNTASVPPEVQKEKCRPLLGYMHGFESSYGDLAQIHKLEKRMAEMFPLEPEILRFGHRFEIPAFDPLKAQIVVSATQTRTRPPPGAFPPQQPPPGGFAAMASPPSGEMRLGPHGPYIGSPKRGLDDSEADTPSRKFMRGESPIKGAAGKRIATSGGNMSANVPTTNTNMNANAGGGSGGFAVKNFVPGGSGAQMPASAPQQPAPLPRGVTYLLSILPNAASYQQTRLDPALTASWLSNFPLPGMV